MQYEIRDNKVIVDKDSFNEESEIQYLNFVLGYDLLNNFYKDSIYSECDVNYDFSDYLSRKFIKSEEYQNTKYSTYEMLEKWLKNNMKSIKKEYEEFIGKTKDIYVVGNYICIVDDYNYDNPKESIVMIYKNNKDYRNGDYLEQVSLSNDNIRKNIKDYIIDTYNVKNYKDYEREYMSRELFKSMVYKDNKVYTRQCSNNVNPKNYDREENKGLTRLYQEKGQEDFEKYFLTNLILEGNVEILSGCNNTLRRLNYLANLLWKNKEFIKLRNKEDEIFTKSLNTKTEEEKNNIQIEYNNIKEDIKKYVSSFYDNHTRLNRNMERGR